MISRKFDPGSVHLIRLRSGSDILDELTGYAVDNSVTAAWFTYLGAVSSAGLRYYDQNGKTYRDFTIDRHLEVLSGVGNVSLLDGAPFGHTHAVFADEDGNAFGGHLDTGCRVWALEIRLQELLGAPLVRTTDHCTGLALWGGTVPEG